MIRGWTETAVPEIAPYSVVKFLDGGRPADYSHGPLRGRPAVPPRGLNGLTSSNDIHGFWLQSVHYIVLSENQRL